MILDGVIGAAREEAGYGGPLVTEPSMGPNYGLVLFRREGPVLDLWRQLVAPSEPARFPRPARNGPADEGPVSGPMPLHELLKSLVLLRAPRALDPVHFLSGHGHHNKKVLFCV